MKTLDKYPGYFELSPIPLCHLTAVKEVNNLTYCNNLYTLGTRIALTERMKTFIFISLFSLSISSFAAAFVPPVPKEGFNTGSENMPKVLSDNWASTFFVLIETPTTYRTGTSFLIHKESRDLFDELYFVTNNHVIMKDCPNIGSCSAIKLMQKALLVTDEDGEGLVDLEDEAGVEYTGVEILKKSINPDIVLMKVVVPKSPKTPKPMKLASSCSGATNGKIYSIGFSGTSVRTAPKHLQIENQEMTYKRWSQGIATGATQINIENESLADVEGTTVDALPGGSGGPMLNSKGEVIGLMKAALSGEENKYAYRGSEITGALKPTSYMIGCDTLRDFLDIEELRSCMHP